MPGVEVTAPGLTVAAVARRLGVAPATLRTWSRRYGLGPDAHTAGAHRRYGPDDIARLELMRSLTQGGVAPADAARAALAAQVDRQPGQASPAGDAAAGLGKDPAKDPAKDRASDLAGSTAGDRRSGRVRGLARAAQALDAARVTSLLRDALERDGVGPTWDTLLAPALVAIGRRWAAGQVGVEVEHLLSECAMAALREAAQHQLAPVSPRSVVIAAAAEEQHTLATHAVAAALAERRVAVRVLGARVPQAALGDAVRRCGPGAVFVWSQLPPTGAASYFAGLPRTRPAVTYVAGGPGWADDLPAHLTRVGSLSQAVAVLARAAG
jgi:DNA-binding transcriptional MerR regulator